MTQSFTSNQASDYGGDFPWAGRTYRLKVESGGATLLRWASQMAKTVADQRIFHSDGSIRLKSLKPVTMAGVQLCWRWDPLSARMIIDFLWQGKKLGWRWDELTPVGDEMSMVSKWNGIGHVGASSYSFSLTLIELERPLFAQSWPTVRASVLDMSMNVNHSSLAGEVDLGKSVVVEDTDIVKNIVSRYSSCMDSGKANIQRILEIIDRMWLQELVLQSRAELLNNLVGAAADIENGSEPNEIITRTLHEVDSVNAMVLDSVRVRSEARGSVSLAGGLEALHHIIAEQLEEVAEGLRPLIDQLVEPTLVGEVSKHAERMLRNILEEMEALSELKEANSDTFMVLEESLDDLHSGESAFIDTILQVARANPQNSHLQKTCVETLMCTPDACRNLRANIDGCITLLLDTMLKHTQHSPLQETCCKAINQLTKCFPEAAGQVGSRGGVDSLLLVLVNHAGNEATMGAALSALLSLTINNANNKLKAASSGAVQVVEVAMEKHDAGATTLRLGHDLMGILVLASAVRNFLVTSEIVEKHEV